MVTAARGHALMHRAQARYGYGSGIHGNGIIIGYCDGPEYIIRRDDGTQFHWRCDLTVVGDEVDPANLPELSEVPPGWVPAERLDVLADLVNVTAYERDALAATVERVRAMCDDHLRHHKALRAAITCEAAAHPRSP